MLDIILPETDEAPSVKISLEHSLLALSKWEAIYEKPFFGHEPKTGDETKTYLTLMVVGENPPEDFLDRVTVELYEEIAKYINSKQTATTFGFEQEQKGRGETITAEVIYHWLIQFQIPFHPVETWHLNRLMTLVKVCGVKQSKPKKMSRQQLAEKYRAMNEQRRQELGTSG